MDTSVHPPVVSRLHYEFEGWLGDVLIESFPCFVVTASAQGRLTRMGATGARFGEVQISKSPEFMDFQPVVELPSFAWLQPTGAAGVDDFGTAADGRLVVSERAVEILRDLQLSNAQLAPWLNGST